jgi:glucokinase
LEQNVTILLAGDVGGTKTILRLVNSESTAATSSLPVQTLLYEQTYASRDFADLVPMVRQFLAIAPDSLGNPSEFCIEKACFGIAGPVVNNSSELTNLSWSLSAERLQRDLGIAQVKLINDFAAIGYGILGLSPADLLTLQAAAADTKAPIAVLGAGTGLGEGFLIPFPDGSYCVFPSEGSHADFAPRSLLEFQLLSYIREKNNLDRVSVERVVSGMGIISIYQFLRDRDPSQESPALVDIYHAWQQELGTAEKTVDLAAVISRAAIEQTDYLCQQAMRLFIEAYGAEAGNLALKLLPYGGLYLAGGIVTKILPLMQGDCFLNAFSLKGRMSSLLKRVPVHLVKNPKVGLIGAALYAAF